jgi:hypothetical protein
LNAAMASRMVFRASSKVSEMSSPIASEWTPRQAGSSRSLGLHRPMVVS